jgi:hypothetical protein
MIVSLDALISLVPPEPSELWNIEREAAEMVAKHKGGLISYQGRYPPEITRDVVKRVFIDHSSFLPCRSGARKSRTDAGF